MIKRAVCLVALLFLLPSSGSMAGGQREFIIDVPDATFTRVIGLNAQGDVCGGTQVEGVRLAFTESRQADITDLTTFAYPGSIFTQCRAINAKGQMVDGAWTKLELTECRQLDDGCVPVTYTVWH